MIPKDKVNVGNFNGLMFLKLLEQLKIDFFFDDPFGFFEIIFMILSIGWSGLLLTPSKSSIFSVLIGRSQGSKIQIFGEPNKSWSSIKQTIHWNMEKSRDSLTVDCKNPPLISLIWLEISQIQGRRKVHTTILIKNQYQNNNQARACCPFTFT